MKGIIFTDGSSRGNPGNGGFGVIILENGIVREIGGREGNTTNNRMEMMAAIQALKNISGGDIEIHADSAYLINGITKWVHGWQENNWRTKTKKEVLNEDLWQELVEVIEGKNIEWKRISGHSGVPANERCDVIATSFADSKPIVLYVGPVSGYKVDLSITEGTEKGIRSKSNKKAVAYSYVSMVHGKIEIHRTWAECEARVKGKSGARFKKAVSKDDEEAIIAEFKRLG